MKINQVLVESAGATVAFAFGRFNPAHQGHIEVWRTVEQAGANWFIGTNATTIGPNDPLTFEQKSAWMEEIYPPIAGHIVSEQSVLTLAAYIFKKVRKNERATVAYITDAADWAWSGKLLNQYNGVEGAHGYYKFAQITHVPSPRVSSATALRDAARADDKVAFYHASGTDPKSKVAGLTYFDTVKQAVEKYPLPVKRGQKVKEPVVAEGYTDDPRFQRAMKKIATTTPRAVVQYPADLIPTNASPDERERLSTPIRRPGVNVFQRMLNDFLDMRRNGVDTEEALDRIRSDLEESDYEWTDNEITSILGDLNVNDIPDDEKGVAEGVEHFDGIEISMEKEDDEINVKAMMAGGRELGHVLFVIDGEYLMPQDLEVDERYQGQGIAATMYNYVKSKGYKIRRSGQQTDAGAGFWDKHKPGKNVWEQGVAEGNLKEFAPGAGDEGGGEDPYKYPKPESYRRSADFFGQFEADHFDREDMNDATGEFKGYWGKDQIAYFKFNNPAKTGSDDPGMGWYYEPQSNLGSDKTSAASTVDMSAQRKQQELSMIDAFLKSGQTPKPGSQIYSLMKRHNMVESEQQTVAKTWDQMTSQEKLSGVKGRTVWNERTQKYYTVFDVPVKQSTDEASLATMRDYFAGDKNAQDPTTLAKQRQWFDANKDINGRTVVQKKFRSKWDYEQWLKQNKLKQISGANESTNDKGWSLTNKKQQ